MTPNEIRELALKGAKQKADSIVKNLIDKASAGMTSLTISTAEVPELVYKELEARGFAISKQKSGGNYTISI